MGSAAHRSAIRAGHLIACTIALAFSAWPIPASGQHVATFFKQTSPAVVFIVGLAGAEIRSLSSGFIVTSDGIVITNAHVVEGASRVAIKLASGRVFEDVAVLYKDRNRDLAVLFIPGQALPVVRLGDSNRVEVGEEVIAIGNPQGLENTVTKGIIGGRRHLDGYDYIQTDAALSQGSSGGPILNIKGEVIGVTVSRLRASQNIGFAIPVNDAQPMIRRAVAALKEARERLARQRAEEELTRRKAAEEEARRLLLEAEAARRAEAEETRRREMEREAARVAEEKRRLETRCVMPSAPSSVLLLGSREMVGELVRTEISAGKCYYIVRRADGALWSVESSRAWMEPSKEKSLAQPLPRPPDVASVSPPAPPSLPSIPQSPSPRPEAPPDPSPYTWYLRSIERKVSEAWKRPFGGHVEHEVVIVFDISLDGHVRGPGVGKSSGNADFDWTALQAIAEAAPFPPVPSGVRGLLLTVSLSFRPRDGGIPAILTTTLSPEDMYKSAYTAYTKGGYSLAVGGFRQVLRRFPDHSLAGDAQYWIGEVHFNLARAYFAALQVDRGREEIEKGVEEFRKVVADYPWGQRVAAAIYKEALGLIELKRPAQAQARLEYLVANFPQAEETPLARERLAALRSANR